MKSILLLKVVCNSSIHVFKGIWIKYAERYHICSPQLKILHWDNYEVDWLHDVNRQVHWSVEDEGLLPHQPAQ